MSLRDGERGRASFLYKGRRSTEGSGGDLNPPYYWNGAETEGIEAEEAPYFFWKVHEHRNRLALAVSSEIQNIISE